MACVTLRVNLLEQLALTHFLTSLFTFFVIFLKEYSAPTSKDTIGNSIQIEKLIEEKTQLDKKCIKLLEEKKTLSKRCDELGKNCDKFRDMLQKNPEKVDCVLPWYL